MEATASNNLERENRLTSRNASIKQDYLSMTSERYKGKRVYHSEAILLKLAEKYYLSERTIENIVFRS